MIERDPIGNDLRARSREARLGIDAACLLCGEAEPSALRVEAVEATSLPPRLLEDHHLAGRSNDRDLTIRLCRNCHSKLTSMQLCAGADLSSSDARSMPERLVEVLSGLGLFFEVLAQSCARWAESLRAFVTSLDERHPGWRKLPTAKD